MRRKGHWIWMLGAVGFSIAAVLLCVRSARAGDETLETRSRARYVHRISLYDENGDVIRLTDDSGKPMDPDFEPIPPFSTRNTCGKCHDMGQVHAGWHFNAMADPEHGRNRPGEPWFLVDAATGTQLPLSWRSWPGTWKPADVGITPWEFVQKFGRHMPGGGPGENHPSSTADRMARWSVTGNLEVDCLSCHAADNRHDQNERARQIERQNFRWIPSAASGVAVVRGEARNAADDYDPTMPSNPDRPGPVTIYDPGRFDANERVFLDITRTPSAGRCSFCHTTRPAEDAAPARWATDTDVHLAAGMSCADCHRNGIDHNIVRGYEGEAADRGQPALATFTCQGCHMGVEGADGLARLGGRLGAPVPKHAGLPPVHFEKLSCTACHAGPWPEKTAHRIQTAMAHGLGVASKEHLNEALPYIVSPVYRTLQNGKLAPHKMVWPAFWGRLTQGKVTPLEPESVQKAAAEVFRTMAKEKYASLNEESISKILTALAPKKGADGEPVYISGGQLYRREENGRVVGANHKLAQPYAWSIGHNVRPATQSLGARGCTDCHAADSAFSHGTLEVASPAHFGESPKEPNNPLMAESSTEELFESSFLLRPAFKVVGIVAAFTVALVLAVCLFSGLTGRLKRMGEKT